ncbi:MAG: S1 RNA-binding domain-containing protein [Turicibacter sp.]|nr:S1 RNA-binding domain-containing protein [Turicibacter sp.]
MDQFKAENEEMSMSDVLNFEDFNLPSVGDTIEGEVVRVTPSEVTVDINGATEGTIYLSELSLAKVDNAHEVVKVGDKIQAVIKKINDEQILLSPKALMERGRFNELKAAFENGEVLQAKVTRAMKNALIVNVGMEAFLPASMIDVEYVSELDSYVGQTIPVRIVEFNNRNRRMTVSRKAVVAEQQKLDRTSQLETLAIGDVFEGKVVRIQPYGAFVRFGALEGMVHISEISHTGVSKIEDALSIGQEVSVKVIKVDGLKISLSIKAAMPTPFEEVSKVHQVGDVVSGEVTQLTEYGAFVKLAEGVEGLVHMSELSWGHRPKVEDVVSQGQAVNVKIISLNPETGRIGLSIKQIDADPWTVFPNQVGDVVKGKVTNVTELGAFISVAPFIEGLAHFSEASWNPSVRMADLVSVGDEVDVKIISFDSEKHRIGLSLRQVKNNPWSEAGIKEGDVVEGTVTGMNSRGAHVAIAEDVVGFLPINQIADKRISKVEDELNQGQAIKAKVMKFDANRANLELSIRRIEEDAERAEFNKYIKEQDSVENETLGDLFGDSLKDLL